MNDFAVTASLRDIKRGKRCVIGKTCTLEVTIIPLKETAKTNWLILVSGHKIEAATSRVTTRAQGEYEGVCFIESLEVGGEKKPLTYEVTPTEEGATLTLDFIVNGSWVLRRQPIHDGVVL